MLLASGALILGLILLVWSADRFVHGAALTAKHVGMSPLLIGMVVVGFGTSAPEMMVSALAAIQGNPGIALGNAYGSNITNIALILGLTALIKPITVQQQILRKELPILLAVTALAAWQLYDNMLSRFDAIILLVVFTAIMTLTIVQGMRHTSGAVPDDDDDNEQSESAEPLGRAVVWLVIGLIVLILSSRLLVWGAVILAQGFGVDDLIIGLTIVAIGTSLPELASSLVAIRKNEHDIALGNVLGSNLFNTLAVVGIAGSIHPLAISPELLYRDLLTMAALTILLLIFGYSSKGAGRVNRFEGAILLASYVGYTVFLLLSVF